MVQPAAEPLRGPPLTNRLPEAGRLSKPLASWPSGIGQGIRGRLSQLTLRHSGDVVSWMQEELAALQGEGL